MALDNSSYLGVVTATSQSASFTVGSGSNRYLLVGVTGTTAGADVITGVTYNGSSLTKVGSSVQPTGGRWISLWYLLAPASGSNTLTVNASGSDWIETTVVSLQDIKQITPEANNSSTATGTTNGSVSITPVSNYSFIFAYIKSGGGQTVGANTSLIKGSGSDGSFDNGFVQRSDNPITDQTSKTIAWTTSGSNTKSALAVSLEGIPGVASGGSFLTNFV